jgi:YbgC/YbaW family acyl-CoA thioester hydrolase
MNLLFRFLYLLIAMRFRPRLSSMFEKAQTPFRVWFTDLDLLMHMNNGKYLSLMDLARVDLMWRCGALQILRKNDIYPVLAAETITFKKSLRLFNSFYIQTQVLGWDEKDFYLEQQFFCNDELYARALVKARMLRSKGGKISPAECLTLTGNSTDSPIFPDYLQKWLDSLAIHS